MRSVPRISVTRPLANTRQWCHLWLSVTREPPDLVLPPSFDNTVAFNLVCICSWLVLCICTVFVQYLYSICTVFVRHKRFGAAMLAMRFVFDLLAKCVTSSSSLEVQRCKYKYEWWERNTGWERDKYIQVKSINAVFEVGVVFTVFFSFRHQVSACWRCTTFLTQ